MNKTKLVLTTAAFLGIAGLASVSVAETTVTYPGIECIDTSDTSPEMFYDGGKAFNDSDIYDSWMECPIARIDSNLAGSITGLHARVDDSHTGEAVECHVRSCAWSGGSCFYSVSDASAGTGFQSLSLGSVGVHTNGIAYLRCHVPDKQTGDRSGILSYRATD